MILNFVNYEGSNNLHNSNIQFSNSNTKFRKVDFKVDLLNKSLYSVQMQENRDQR